MTKNLFCESVFCYTSFTFLLRLVSDAMPIFLPVFATTCIFYLFDSKLFNRLLSYLEEKILDKNCSTISVISNFCIICDLFTRRHHELVRKAIN